MRGKKAKTLRKQAQHLTVGEKPASYQVRQRERFAKIKGEKVSVITTQVRLNRTSTRGMYQQLKAASRRPRG